MMIRQPHTLTFGKDQGRAVGDVEQCVGVVLIHLQFDRFVHGSGVGQIGFRSK